MYFCRASYAICIKRKVFIYFLKMTKNIPLSCYIYFRLRMVSNGEGEDGAGGAGVGGGGASLGIGDIAAVTLYFVAVFGVGLWVG